MGSSFLSSLLLPQPIWEIKVAFYNPGWIEMENCLFFGITTVQIFTQFVHLVLLPDPLTAMKRVGVE